MKVVINRCYGGFGLSARALLWLAERGSPVVELQTLEEYYGADEDGMVDSFKGPKYSKTPVQDYHAQRMGSAFPPTVYQGRIVVFNDRSADVEDWDTAVALTRSHPDLVECVELLGEAANDTHAKLGIVEIPDGIEFVIDEYDGSERVAEKHRTWS
ncbi:MAG: hypothetical protein JSS66_07790 [Armatimonadetes bacterium]|nr:hypothetical protein [Armatimonadota bacterium]